MLFQNRFERLHSCLQVPAFHNGCYAPSVDPGRYRQRPPERGIRLSRLGERYLSTLFPRPVRVAHASDGDETWDVGARSCPILRITRVRVATSSHSHGAPGRVKRNIQMDSDPRLLRQHMRIVIWAEVIACGLPFLRADRPGPGSSSGRPSAARCCGSRCCRRSVFSPIAPVRKPLHSGLKGT